MRHWLEVRNNHYDEVNNARLIEGYRTPYFTEEPTVIATIDEDTGEIKYTDAYEEGDIFVKKAIAEKEAENTREFTLYACTYDEEDNVYKLMEATVRGLLDEYTNIVTLRGVDGAFLKLDRIVSSDKWEGLYYITSTPQSEDSIRGMFREDIHRRLRQKITYYEYKLKGDIVF